MHAACLDFAEEICNMEAGSVCDNGMFRKDVFFFLLASCSGNLAGYRCFV
jgi:hypothetical protein